MLPIRIKTASSISMDASRSSHECPHDGPNTPSKSKGLHLVGSKGLHAIMLIIFSFGFLIFSPSWVGTHKNLGQASYRRSLVDKMALESVDNKLQSSYVVQRAYRHEALEIIDTLSQSHQDEVDTSALEESVAGGSSFDQLRNGANKKGSLSNDNINPVSKIISAHKADGKLEITQILSSGISKTLLVDPSRYEFLEEISKGLKSEDLKSSKKLAGEWWSNVVSNDGLFLDPVIRPPINNSAYKASLISFEKLNDLDSSTAANNSCSIFVLDANMDVGPLAGSKTYDLDLKRMWPFAREGHGIDGFDAVPAKYHQAAMEYWLANSIRSSHRATSDIDTADAIFVDMWAYHMAWIAYTHPLGSRNMSNPEASIRRAIKYITKMDRFTATQGRDFAMTIPTPLMRKIFTETTMCEDLSSVFHMAPERSLLCIWKQNAALNNRALILPYLSILDLNIENSLDDAQRDIFLLFRGGCGYPDPSIIDLFTAGKMLRYELVQSLNRLRESDIQAECSCDICDNHIEHSSLQKKYRNARFCPVIASDSQSTRSLSEIVMAGCIPVFIGPPFHSLPLSTYVDYKMGIFINISQQSWIDDTSADYLRNHMVRDAWPLELAQQDIDIVQLESLNDVVSYLRSIKPEFEKEKRSIVLQERWKLYYGAKPLSDGGNNETSELAEFVMQKMCSRAAEAKQRRSIAANMGHPSKLSLKNGLQPVKD